MVFTRVFTRVFIVVFEIVGVLLNTHLQILNFDGALYRLLITDSKRSFTECNWIYLRFKTDFTYLSSDFTYLSGDLCFENWICVLKADFVF